VCHHHKTQTLSTSPTRSYSSDFLPIEKTNKRSNNNMSSFQLDMLEEDDISVASMSDLSFDFGSSEDVVFDDTSICSSIKCPETATFRSLGPASPDPTQSFTMTLASTMQSRFVSVESMSQVSSRQSPTMNNTKNHTAPRKSNPLSALMDFISKKQKQQINSSKRSPLVPSSTMTGETRIAAVFSKPSEVLSQVVQKSSASCSTGGTSFGPATNERKPSTPTTFSQSVLHEVCCRRGSDLTVAEVEAILDQDSKAASRLVLMTKLKRVYNPSSGKGESKVVPETYQYPLNLAISYKASPDVLAHLVAAAPDVLSLTDGKSCSLHILLRHKPTDSVSADMMLLKKPEMVFWTDAKKNLALHVAASCGASVQTVRHMTGLYPEALLQPNFHGEIPLALAQRSSSVCLGDVCDYLWNEVERQF
jgi:hypothetical protein